jgi:hypothetical protein
MSVNEALGALAKIVTRVDRPLRKLLGNVLRNVLRGAIGTADPDIIELIVTRIVELAKAGVYDIEELSSRTFSSLRLAG